MEDAQSYHLNANTCYSERLKKVVIACPRLPAGRQGRQAFAMTLRGRQLIYDVTIII